MDKPTPVERIEDVREAICQIREFLKEFSMEQFLLDKKVQSAVLFQFVIIGEAIRSLSASGGSEGDSLSLPLPSLANRLLRTNDTASYGSQRRTIVRIP